MSSVPNPDYLSTDGERSAPYDASAGERRLWVAVILRAFMDAIWIDPNPGGAPTEKIPVYGTWFQRNTANRLRDETIFWLTLDNARFRQVCEYAGLDPLTVRRWARRIINATDDEKARWASADLSLHDLRAAGELRPGG